MIDAAIPHGAVRHDTVESWGRISARQGALIRPWFREQLTAELRATDDRPLLLCGFNRSYGDVALNCGGRLIATPRLGRFISADWERGVICAEAGLSLDRLLRTCVPRGWFLPVSPGTKFVTLGGAVANDIHGKNHETAGTIGCHVRRIELARSTGEVLELSGAQNADLFAATIGGLGLTGAMLSIELQLIPIRSAYFVTETLKMVDLDHFFRLARDSAEWPYTVAWIDGFARERAIGRGLFSRARHCESGPLTVHRAPRWKVPAAIPRVLNASTIRLFNLFYQRWPWRNGIKTAHYDAYLYPLDAVSHWNHLYGADGFFQHQSVVPMQSASETLRELLRLAAASGEVSFFAVLKLLGNRRSPGLLSFPMYGATIALDFPNRGNSTRRLMAQLTEVVVAAGGRLYPAKDATMSPQAFRSGYPNWRKIEEQRDPAIISDFWRRVAGGQHERL
jgi:FAD/FMN-containing dehydrogenase